MTKKITKKAPSLFNRAFEDFNTLFNDLLDLRQDKVESFGGFPKGDQFIDKDGNTIIEMALASYSKNQLNVSVEGKKLIVVAQKCEKSGDKIQRSLSKRAFRREFNDYAYRWDLENALASYKNGLLRIIIEPFNKKEVETKNVDIE